MHSLNSCSTQKYSKREQQRGFTLPELMVSIVLGLLVTGLTLSSSYLTRFSISKDIARTRLNQNIRGAIDILGLDIRVAGENLNNSFPAIEIVNSTTTTSDRLILRRNLLEEVLPVCTTITATSTVTQITIARTTTTPGCTYSGQTHNYNTWQSYRSATSGSVKAFIYDTVLRRGEFFTYISGTNTGTQYQLNTAAKTWQYGYTAGTSAVYMLEEWEYRRESELIKLIENRDTTTPYNVAFGTTDFQVTATLNDNSVVSVFDNTRDWTTLAAVEISMTGSEQSAKKTMTRTLTGKFFPRNILSN
jgi:type IV pilus assembly protein PilW